ncbi:zinc dependent phospholipase C family protein [Desulfitobacterium sp.]|uniref:zinc dependent phospholipase C family protein n=1 Tax=Desulfitobacterium sp. TaxID=49981 RepID=UPI002BA2E71D|nr:zinc dependent phospholipase C family protein [Desulfitobacterium sp.]HVJ48980.1 zinc dependent phospholipase C family protein [Desulfitobacterium sp.]
MKLIQGSEKLFILTHKIVAQQTIAHLNNQNYSFNKLGFIWGNMKPDIAPNLIAKPHYQRESLNFVVLSILSLCCLPASFLDVPMRRKYISVQMGVICHFLSDFFTLPHSLRWKLDSLPLASKHLKYETILQQKASLRSIPHLALPTISSISKESITLFVTKLHNQYQLREDYMNDLRYSVQISSVISALILHTIQENVFADEEFGNNHSLLRFSSNKFLA